MGVLQRLGVLLAALALVGVSLQAQPANDLMPFLQSEVNEISLLTAQSNYLQQQGDPLGAALIASYIPDHQMQAQALSTAISAMGGNPATITPTTAAPFLGSRLAVIQYDEKHHQMAIRDYQRFARRTSDPTSRQLAIIGASTASRHFNSLVVAQGGTTGTDRDIRNSLLAAITLEQGSISDLRTQSAQLCQLGNSGAATLLSNQIPAHQQQVITLTSLITQMGGNPSRAAAPLPTAALPTSTAILQHDKSPTRSSSTPTPPLPPECSPATRYRAPAYRDNRSPCNP